MDLSKEFDTLYRKSLNTKLQVYLSFSTNTPAILYSNFKQQDSFVWHATPANH